MHEAKQLTGLISILAIFTLTVFGTGIVYGKAYADGLIEDVIVYENPTDIKQLTNVPLQLIIGLGVALAAITIIVLYRARR